MSRIDHTPLFDPKAPGIRRVRDWTERECKLETRTRGQVDLKDIRQRLMSAQEAFDRAVIIAERFEADTHFCDDMTSKVGAPRAVPWPAAITLFLYALIFRPHAARLTDITASVQLVEDKLAGLGCKLQPLEKPEGRAPGWRAHQKRGGFDYSHIESTLEDLRRSLEPADSVHRAAALARGHRWRQASMNAAEFSTALLRASIADFPDTKEVSLDATHLLTFGRTQYEIDHKINRDAEISKTPRQLRNPRKGSRVSQRKGPDGRRRPTTDPDASQGHFTNTRSKRQGDDIGTGYALELLVPIPEMGKDNMPFVASGFAFRPMGATRVQDLTDMIDEHRKCHDIKVIALDRGYTDDNEFYIQLFFRDIKKSQDLNTNQHNTRPATVSIGFWKRGQLFTRGTPTEARKVKPIAKSFSFHERVDAAADYEYLHLFRFTPKGSPVLREGRFYQDFRGPALRGKVWCKNWPELRPDDHAVPETTCPSGPQGIACHCGSKSITVEIPASQMKARQRSPYGSIKWIGDYFRRNAVETFNSLLKDLEIKMERGYTRVFGLIKNHALLAFAVAAVNVHSQRNWHHKRLLQDPWALIVGDLPQYFHTSLRDRLRLSHDEEAAHRRIRPCPRPKLLRRI